MEYVSWGCIKKDQEPKNNTEAENAVFSGTNGENHIALNLRFETVRFMNVLQQKLNHLQVRWLKWRLQNASEEQIFKTIYKHNLWRGRTSVSGPGSDPEQTVELTRQLGSLLKKLGIHSMLDLPCGDREWMQHVDLTGITYIGGDIVPGLINTLQKQNHAETCTYQILDMIRGPLPSTEMILCRDGLVHLPFPQAMNAMNTFLNSNATWLLTTTFPQRLKNRSVDMPGEWSPYNLEKAPFSLPPPQEMLVENCSEENGAFRDKALGLWRIKDLRS